MRSICVGLVALMILLAAQQAQAEPKPDPRENLNTAIPEAVRLLEAQEYASFLKTFVLPEQLKKVTAEIPLDTLAKQFGEKKAPRLVEVLKSIQTEKPTLDESGTATYTIKDQRPLVWKKVDKYWYMQN